MVSTLTVDGEAYFAAQQTEIDFMRNVLAYAKLRGWLSYHTHISKRSTEGWPDCVFAKPGRLVIAELKRESGGRVSPAQREWIAVLKTVLADVYVWRPSDWPEIERILR